MTKADASKLVAFLFAAFPGSKTTAGTPAVYEHSLADLDGPAAWAAVELLVATHDGHLPNVATIRAAVSDLQNGPRCAGGDAWGEVRKAIGSAGAYRTPSFADPLVARSVAAMGWRELCLSENQAADRARFIDLYDSLSVSQRVEDLSAQLPAVKAFRQLQAARSEPVAIAKLLPWGAK